MEIKKKTIDQMNVTQNNMIRYALGIGYNNHIKNIMRCLQIVDSKTTYYLNKCTTIKLLHRHEVTKAILVDNIFEKKMKSGGCIKILKN